MFYKVPLTFEPQPEGGYTVTSPALPELVTEGDTLDEAYENARDALAAVVEIYEDQGRTFPSQLCHPSNGTPFHSDVLVEGP